MIGFFCVSDNFITSILSNNWIGASAYIKIFCVCFLFNIIQNGNLQAIKAIGRSDIVLKLEVIKKSLYFIVLLTTILFSNSPIYIAGAAIINTVIATIINTYPNRKLIGYSYKMQFCDLFSNLVTAIVMGMVVYFVGKYLYIDSSFVLLIIQVLVGFIVYIVFSLISKNKNLKYLINLLMQLFL